MTLVRPEEFSCRTTVDDGQAVVAVTGDLDMSTAPGLSDWLTELLEWRPRAHHSRPRRCRVHRLHWAHPAGAHAPEGPRRGLALTSPTASVRRVLEIVGLDGLLG